MIMKMRKCHKIFHSHALDLWKRTSVQLHYDYSAGWSFFAAPEVRQHASENMMAENRDATERLQSSKHCTMSQHRKIIGKGIEEVVDLFCSVLNYFEKKTMLIDSVGR